MIRRLPHQRVQACLATVVALCAWACSAVQVTPVATSVRKPGTVAHYLAVTNNGQPTTGLQLENFTVKEDGVSLDPAAVQLRLLPRAPYAVHQVILLVDIGGQPSEEDQTWLGHALVDFVGQLREFQPVSVFAFDGAEELHALTTVEKGPFELSATQQNQLRQLKPADPSRNLYGALQEGLATLTSKLPADSRQARVGTVIFIARGPDLAGRISESALWDQLKLARYHILGVTIGEWAADGLGFPLQDAQVFHAQGLELIGDATDKAAKLTNQIFQQHYLLAYCSPSRAGTRQLSIEVSVPQATGQAEPAVGTLTSSFSADGFGSGCHADGPVDFTPPPEPSNKGTGAAP